MNRTPVESTNIKSVGFDQATKTLEIEFKGGGVYDYTGDVAEEHYKALMAAESKGKYFGAHIRNDKRLTVKKAS